jgi:hypothetical protein
MNTLFPTLGAVRHQELLAESASERAAARGRRQRRAERMQRRAVALVVKARALVADAHA